MKSFLYLLAGVTAAAAYVIVTQKTGAKNIVTQQGSADPVDSLAHKLQDAWADHHTVA